jgi:small subunit ribosomal protein S8
MINFILSDMISKLNIASKNRIVSIKVKNTKFCLNVLNILYKNGVIRNYYINEKFINIFLKYYQNRSVFYNIEVISRPGRRVFFSLNNLSLKYSFNNFSGFFIISTSKGIFTSNDCLLGYGISGEILLKINI